MNTLDAFVSLYNFQRHKMRLLSPFRFITRELASFFIPKWLERSDTICHLPAREYLAKYKIEKKIIISLTTFPARISEVWQVIECMKRQTVSPDKILLWLSKDQFPNRCVPENLIQKTNDVFEIRFVDGDIRSHKKYYYAFNEFPNDIVILVDDDIYYPTTMIECLLSEHVKHPNAIIMRYGDILKYNDNGELLKYNEWFKEMPEAMVSPFLFFGTGGGTLFQPKLLLEDVLDIDNARSVTPLADDIWLNAYVNLSRINKIKIKYSLPLCIKIENNQNLYSENVYNNKNDLQFEQIQKYCIKRYGLNPFSQEYINNEIK